MTAMPTVDDVGNPVDSARVNRLTSLRKRRDRLMRALASINAEIDGITDGENAVEPVELQPPDWSRLSDYLRQLHHQAGEPSSRSIARNAGVVSHTTVSETLRGTRVPLWKTLWPIARELGADERVLRDIWARCHTQGTQNGDDQIDR